MQVLMLHRIQSLFNSLGDEVKGKTIGLGGDGRYYNKEAAQLIIKMAAANGVKKVPLRCTFDQFCVTQAQMAACAIMHVLSVHQDYKPALLLRYWLAKMLSWPLRQCLL